MRRLTLILLAALGALTACTPEQVHWYLNDATPGEQAAVDQALRERAAQRSRGSRDCYEAIDRHWPGDKARAKKVVWRESRNNPAAANKRSSARGCMQLLAPLHGHRYSAVGCSPSSWANADCGIKAAAHLYREAGWSPWALTA